MPQMAPMNWNIIYLMFIMLSTMFMINIYYNKQMLTNKKIMNYTKMTLNWKW
uniref:ATP synthase F0 subunit 8 n=1 Tax=Megalophasma granulatum TaxID=2042296 RepID=A0A343KJS8_9NEOP|nr:ATP synthase F0 subunit 8 [Megalophasma granulatum]